MTMFKAKNNKTCIAVVVYTSLLIFSSTTYYLTAAAGGVVVTRSEPATIEICLQQLLKSDINGDYRLHQNEFLLLLQEISCVKRNRLSWNQIQAFHSLACVATCRVDRQYRSTSQQQHDNKDDCFCSLTDPTATIVLIDKDNNEGSSDLLQSLVCDFAISVVEGATKPFCGGLQHKEQQENDDERSRRHHHRRRLEEEEQVTSPMIPPSVPSTVAYDSSSQQQAPSPVSFLQIIISDRIPLPGEPLESQSSSLPPFLQKFPWFQKPAIPVPVPPPTPADIATIEPSWISPLPPLERADIPTFKPLINKVPLKNSNRPSPNNIFIPSIAPTSIPLPSIAVETTTGTNKPVQVQEPPATIPQPAPQRNIAPPTPVIVPNTPPLTVISPINIPVSTPIQSTPSPTVALPMTTESLPTQPNADCIDRLANADKNQDNALDINEFTTLIQDWRVSDCVDGVDTLFLGLTAAGGLPGVIISIDGAPIQVCDAVQAFINENTNTTCNNSPTASPVTLPAISIALESDAEKDFRKCLQSLVAADIIDPKLGQDRRLDKEEFLTFVSSYSGCQASKLSEEEERVFKSLACECLKLSGASKRCCQARNARVDIDGAQLVSNILRTIEQNDKLKYICTSVRDVLSVVCNASPTTAPQLTSSPNNATDIGWGIISVVDEECRSSLNASDSDQDGFLTVNEYLKFIQLYSNCELTTELTRDQDGIFKVLLAKCVDKLGYTGKCFFPEKISVDGAKLPIYNLTLDQQNTLAEVCQQTDSTLGDQTCAKKETVLVADGLDQCALDLIQADKDGDSLLDSTEYLTFMRTISGCGMNMTDLHISHWYLFQTLACSCRWGANSYFCCVPPNSRLNITGANLTENGRTAEQTTELSQICLASRAVVPSSCEAKSFDYTDDCTDMILRADRDNDKRITETEYLLFLNEEYTQCENITQLSLFQRIGYYVLACYCIILPGNANQFCCLPTIAYVNITGVDWPIVQRTNDMNVLLGLTCLTLKSATQTGCQSLPPSPALPAQQQSTIVDENGYVNEMQAAYSSEISSVASLPNPSAAVQSITTTSKVNNKSSNTTTTTQSLTGPVTQSSASRGKNIYVIASLLGVVAFTSTAISCI